VDLARGFEWTKPQTLRVDPRPEATFWSGAPVTAGAVQAGMELLRRLVPFAASLLRGVQAEATDDWTLTFRVDGPAPGLPLAQASEDLYVHNAGAFPADALASAADWRSADLTGFFPVTQFEPKTRAVLERNERYWSVRPRMAHIRIDEVPDINTRTLAALSGEAHVVGWISTQGARQVDRSRDVRVELPQVIGPVVVLAALDLGALLLAISSLSFLGLAAQPPTPEWGAMLAEGRRSFLEYQHLMVFPRGAIFLAALAFSLLGEGTRDLLDPRGAGRRL
jgi:ABC-type transport system substrate-binding protein